MNEQYFACIDHGGEIELIIWFKSKKLAHKKALEWKKDGLAEDDCVYVCELLEEFKGENNEET